MKIFTTLILSLAIAPVYAEIYKCEENGNTSYQQFPCKKSGEKFIPEKDISETEQNAAVEKLNKDIAIQAEQKKIKKAADDKERLIRAQEENADAAYQNARASKAQALQNAQQAEQIGNQRPYYYPVRPVNPIARPLPPNKPFEPIVKPLPRK
ncbi:hypothetical protein bplSymb_SCF00804P022 [Bathymodiolus platifrons methanotrophic gill symbiont]|uniref:DUF4124 domain-containing protein n=1 Tax=Bathymodiolus platifrons methanotrophic gill symbiont TaxID=113268 RepID=UPI000B41BD14|nr:DUF4124 domain-containing protein [Bathymodiolus platifrons methanotrophic gill symbiont]TXK96312.1 hypothetical protein BMR10_08035 [Methylococcaceae bacterium CS4]TXK97598.1 hypothetical protein BMR11_10060 [Methylococcaceae bacterium CS5]TXL02401.1 hypothetical protein BMR08_18400 [Methylococcaceae bacterium CS2]TXL05242.1 hypothetical protein BMR07_10405 [Methylococcaceae bacterium CS1]TXL19840.1 hypothetical protein BMR06_08160 [Methylococcaceae bacterium HT5]